MFCYLYTGDQYDVTGCEYDPVELIYIAGSGTV